MFVQLDKYASDIYELYEAGILSGSDANGTFNPNSNITRAVIASIIMRMALPTQRVSMLKYGGGAVPATNDFLRVSIGSGTSTTTPVVKPDTGTTVMPTTPDKGTDKPVVKPETSTTRPETSTSTSTTRPSDNNNKPDESKKENTIVKDGFTCVDDGYGNYYVYCKVGMDLSKLKAVSGYTVKETLSPGVDPADIAHISYSGKTVTIRIEAPAGADWAYFAFTEVETESTRPDPEEYADWFFRIYRAGSKSGLVYGCYDHRPSNNPECADAIINHLRDDYGVPHISAHPALNKAADVRAKELATSFSHIRPNGDNSLSTLYREYGYKGQDEAMLGEGEDIYGDTDLTGVMNAWIDSPSHLRPMIFYSDTEYLTHMGIGYYKSGGMALVFGEDYD